MQPTAWTVHSNISWQWVAALHIIYLLSIEFPLVTNISMSASVKSSSCSQTVCPTIHPWLGRTVIMSVSIFGHRRAFCLRLLYYISLCAERRVRRVGSWNRLYVRGFAFSSRQLSNEWMNACRSSRLRHMIFFAYIILLLCAPRHCNTANHNRT